MLTRLRKAVAEKFYKFSSFNINFTFSGGISDTKDMKSDTITIHDLIRVADERLFEAKESGRNRLVGKKNGNK